MNILIKAIIASSLGLVTYSVEAKRTDCDAKNPKAACRTGLAIQRPFELAKEIPKGLVVFDFDNDGCYASSPVLYKRDYTGYEINPGTGTSGTVSGECAYNDQLSKADILFKEICQHNKNTYCARIFALYTVKDQVSNGYSAGHRHDIEHAVIWSKNNVIEYVGVSAHGKMLNYKVDEFPRMSKGSKVFTAVYHKDSSNWGTHALRKSKGVKEGGEFINKESPENFTKNWFGIGNYINISLMKDPATASRYNHKNYIEIMENGNWGKAALEIQENRYMKFLREKQPKEWRDNGGFVY